MTLKPRADITTRDLGDEIILYDAFSETFHILNGTARRIWLMLDGGLSKKEVQRRFKRNMTPFSNRC